MSYQNPKFQREKRPKALWTQTPKGQAQITQATRDKVAKRIERQKARRIFAQYRKIQPSAKFAVRKRIPSKSPEQARRDRLYAPLAKWFKAAHLKCKACQLRNPGSLPAVTDDIHHSHGKVSALYFFFPWFIPVCRECHWWIGANPNDARALGLLCEPGEFNTQAEESVWLLKSKSGNCYVATADGESVSEAFSRKNPGVNYEVKLIE